MNVVNLKAAKDKRLAMLNTVYHMPLLVDEYFVGARKISEDQCILWFYILCNVLLQRFQRRRLETWVLRYWNSVPYQSATEVVVHMYWQTSCDWLTDHETVNPSCLSLPYASSHLQSTHIQRRSFEGALLHLEIIYKRAFRLYYFSYVLFALFEPLIVHVRIYSVSNRTSLFSSASYLFLVVPHWLYSLLTTFRTLGTLSFSKQAAFWRFNRHWTGLPFTFQQSGSVCERTKKKATFV